LRQKSSENLWKVGSKSGKNQGKHILQGGFYPMSTKNLTDSALKNLKTQNKAYKVSDGIIGGMFVAVSPKGKKVFRFAFKFDGKAQLLTLGAYPELTLEKARDLARDAKRLLAQGTNPAATKKAEKAQIRAGETTFRSLADSWLALHKPEWSPVHWTTCKGC
jgi:hypothetical protein